MCTVIIPSDKNSTIHYVSEIIDFDNVENKEGTIDLEVSTFILFKQREAKEDGSFTLFHRGIISKDEVVLLANFDETVITGDMFEKYNKVLINCKKDVLRKQCEKLNYHLGFEKDQILSINSSFVCNEKSVRLPKNIDVHDISPEKNAKKRNFSGFQVDFKLSKKYYHNPFFLMCLLFTVRIKDEKLVECPSMFNINVHSPEQVVSELRTENQNTKGIIHDDYQENFIEAWDGEKKYPFDVYCVVSEGRNISIDTSDSSIETYHFTFKNSPVTRECQYIIPTKDDKFQVFMKVFVKNCDLSGRVSSLEKEIAELIKKNR
jgi:hypothetical protein